MVEQRRAEGVIVLQSIVLRVKCLVKRINVDPGHRKTRELALEFGLDTVGGTERNSLLIRDDQINLLNVVLRPCRIKARRGVIVKNAGSGRQREECHKPLPGRTDDRLTGGIPIQIKAIAGNHRAIATRHGIIEDWHRPAEEREYLRVGQQFREITRAHLHSWDREIRVLGLGKAIVRHN